MKANITGLALAAVIVSSAPLWADVTQDPAFQFPAGSLGIEKDILYAPVNPALALEKPQMNLRKEDLSYPYVNPSIAADLCGIDAPPILDPKVRRQGSHPSVELAARDEPRSAIDLKEARTSLPILLAAPLLLLGRRRK